MNPSRTNRPLSSQVIDRYLLFGLACVLGSVSIALYLACRGELAQSVSVVVAVPLLLLLAGSFVLRRSLSVNETIENQLREVATNSFSLSTHPFNPIPSGTMVAVGWNRLLKLILEQSTLEKLEQRLSERLRDGGSDSWEAIFNALPDGAVVCNAKGNAMIVNQSFLATINKASEAEVKELAMTELLVPVITPASAGKLMELAKKSTSFVVELERGSKIADGIWRLSCTPILEKTFEQGSSLWTLRDVTQQKLAEEMRNQFVFTATHELRTPLANIKAYAETLIDNDDIDIEQQKGFYNILISEANRLARFVDDLLNVSQMESGAISITRHETDIERLIDEVLAKVQPQIHEKSLAFDKKLPAKVPKLCIDKDKIAAALVNLLSNAAKYTPEGGTVRFSVETDAHSIRLHVEDSGIGIGPDELPRLWEKFFRSADPRVQELAGSGLGLAFTHEVARLHGGDLSISSELNAGSRFTLTLPLD